MYISFNNWDWLNDNLIYFSDSSITHKAVSACFIRYAYNKVFREIIMSTLPFCRNFEYGYSYKFVPFFRFSELI